MNVARIHGRRGATLAALVVAIALLSTGCAARWSYRQGRSAGQRGDWDEAVARLTKAVSKNPNNVRYRLELEHARAQAGRAHALHARDLAAAGDTDRAADEMEIATKFDPGNQAIADELRNLRASIRMREEEKRVAQEEQTARARSRGARYPVPELSPRSLKPITLNFKEASLQKVFETLGKLAGVNILLEPDFKDKQVGVQLANVTFQEALDQITLVNKLFYKVVDQNSLLVVTDTAAKRKSYDDIIVRTFYMSNVNDDKEFDKMVQSVTKLVTGIKSTADKTLGAITLVGSPDKLALAEKVLSAYDKSRGEVLIEVQVLDVNRVRARQYGIALSAYKASATFDPIGKGGVNDVRANLLSSLNLSDFLVNLPSTLIASFMQNDSTARLLASPRLRAAEGEKATLKIVSKVPIPQTSFLSYGAGTGGTGGTNQSYSPYTPTTSFTFQDVGVTLELTPRISSGDEVSIKLKAELSSLGTDHDMGGGVKIPEILTRSIDGSVRVRDGESTLIGGLLQNFEKGIVSGVFGLQSVPILNRLFSDQKGERSENEILISLTPHIIRAPRITEEDRRALHIGTEETIRVKGARPSLFGTPEEPMAEAKSEAKPPAPPVAGPIGSPALAPALPATGPAPVSVAPAPVPTSDGAPDGLFSPSQLAVGLNGIGSASLVIRRARALGVVELDLAYDASAVEVSGVTPGALLTLGGRTPTSAVTQPEPGHVHVRLGLPADARAAGSGAIATFSVRGLRAGGTTIRVDNLRLSGPGEGDAAVSAAVEPLSVTVGSR